MPALGRLYPSSLLASLLASLPAYLLVKPAESAVDSPAYLPVWSPAYSEALARLFRSRLSRRLKAILKPPLRLQMSFSGGLPHRAQLQAFAASWQSHCFPKEQKRLLNSISEKYRAAKDAATEQQRPFPASSRLRVEWRLGYSGRCGVPAAL